MIIRTIRNACSAVALLALCAPGVARAHHAMGNAIPDSLMSGLLSGLAHPVIGLDHLLFVVAIGASVGYFGRNAFHAVAFIAATLAGNFVHLSGFSLPYGDVWIALSLIVLGFLLYRNPPAFHDRLAYLFFALAGMLHGYAYGESIVGAEATPLLAYLVGFTAIQSAIALGAYKAMAYCIDKKIATQAIKSLSGVLCVVGTFFLILRFV